MRASIAAAIFALSLPLPVFAQQVQPQSQPFRLENGLTVQFRPMQDANEVALVLLFAVGGDHDPQGRSGLAHLVEHVYVTAAAGETARRSVTDLVQRYPDGWNAQTGDRYTVVATVFPKEKFDLELTEAAARMGDLRITDVDLDREKPRVLQELDNMFAGMPQLAAFNNVRELVRPTPRGGRRGGLPEHVQAIRTDEVQEHWRRYYKPKNATLVLVGGFDRAAARKSISELFGPIPTGEKAPLPGEPGEARFGAVRELAVQPVVPNARPTVAVGFAPPSPSHKLYAPYLVLLTRLYSSLSGAGRNDGVRVMAPVLDDPSFVGVALEINAGETAERATDRLRTLVTKAISPKLRPDEATGVRRGIGPMLGIGASSDAVFVRNPYGLAFSLGRRQQLGMDAASLDALLAKTTEEDLRRAAKEIFGPDRSAAAVISIDPQPK